MNSNFDLSFEYGGRYQYMNDISHDGNYLQNGSFDMSPDYSPKRFLPDSNKNLQKKPPSIEFKKQKMNFCSYECDPSRLDDREYLLGYEESLKRSDQEIVKMEVLPKMNDIKLKDIFDKIYKNFPGEINEDFTNFCDFKNFDKNNFSTKSKKIVDEDKLINGKPDKKVEYEKQLENKEIVNEDNSVLISKQKECYKKNFKKNTVNQQTSPNEQKPPQKVYKTVEESGADQELQVLRKQQKQRRKDEKEAKKRIAEEKEQNEQQAKTAILDYNIEEPKIAMVLNTNNNSLNTSINCDQFGPGNGSLIMTDGIGVYDNGDDDNYKGDTMFDQILNSDIYGQDNTLLAGNNNNDKCEKIGEVLGKLDTCSDNSKKQGKNDSGKNLLFIKNDITEKIDKNKIVDQKTPKGKFVISKTAERFSDNPVKDFPSLPVGQKIAPRSIMPEGLLKDYMSQTYMKNIKIFQNSKVVIRNQGKECQGEYFRLFVEINEGIDAQEICSWITRTSGNVRNVFLGYCLKLLNKKLFEIFSTRGDPYQLNNLIIDEGDIEFEDERKPLNKSSNQSVPLLVLTEFSPYIMPNETKLQKFVRKQDPQATDEVYLTNQFMFVFEKKTDFDYNDSNHEKINWTFKLDNYPVMIAYYEDKDKAQEEIALYVKRLMNINGLQVELQKHYEEHGKIEKSDRLIQSISEKGMGIYKAGADKNDKQVHEKPQAYPQKPQSVDKENNMGSGGNSQSMYKSIDDPKNIRPGERARHQKKIDALNTNDPKVDGNFKPGASQHERAMPSNGECSRCWKPGHFAKDCRANTHCYPKRLDEVICYNCGKAGHVAYNCFSQKKGNQPNAPTSYSSDNNIAVKPNYSNDSKRNQECKKPNYSFLPGSNRDPKLNPTERQNPGSNPEAQTQAIRNQNQNQQDKRPNAKQTPNKAIRKTNNTVGGRMYRSQLALNEENLVNDAFEQFSLIENQIKNDKTKIFDINLQHIEENAFEYKKNYPRQIDAIKAQKDIVISKKYFEDYGNNLELSNLKKGNSFICEIKFKNQKKDGKVYANKIIEEEDLQLALQLQGTYLIKMKYGSLLTLKNQVQVIKKDLNKKFEELQLQYLSHKKVNPVVEKPNDRIVNNDQSQRGNGYQRPQYDNRYLGYNNNSDCSNQPYKKRNYLGNVWNSENIGMGEIDKRNYDKPITSNTYNNKPDEKFQNNKATSNDNSNGRHNPNHPAGFNNNSGNPKQDFNRNQTQKKLEPIDYANFTIPKKKKAKAIIEDGPTNQSQYKVIDNIDIGGVECIDCSFEEMVQPNNSKQKKPNVINEVEKNNSSEKSQPPESSYPDAKSVSERRSNPSFQRNFSENLNSGNKPQYNKTHRSKTNYQKNYNNDKFPMNGYRQGGYDKQQCTAKRTYDKRDFQSNDKINKFQQKKDFSKNRSPHGKTYQKNYKKQNNSNSEHAMKQTDRKHNDPRVREYGMKQTNPKYNNTQARQYGMEQAKSNNNDTQAQQYGMEQTKSNNNDTQTRQYGMEQTKSSNNDTRVREYGMKQTNANNSDMPTKGDCQKEDWKNLNTEQSQSQRRSTASFQEQKDNEAEKKKADSGDGSEALENQIQEKETQPVVMTGGKAPIEQPKVNRLANLLNTYKDQQQTNPIHEDPSKQIEKQDDIQEHKEYPKNNIKGSNYKHLTTAVNTPGKPIETQPESTLGYDKTKKALNNLIETDKKDRSTLIVKNQSYEALKKKIEMKKAENMRLIASNSYKNLAIIDTKYLDDSLKPLLPPQQYIGNQTKTHAPQSIQIPEKPCDSNLQANNVKEPKSILSKRRSSEALSKIPQNSNLNSPYKKLKETEIGVKPNNFEESHVSSLDSHNKSKSTNQILSSIKLDNDQEKIPKKQNFGEGEVEDDENVDGATTSEIVDKNKKDSQYDYSNNSTYKNNTKDDNICSSSSIRGESCGKSISEKIDQKEKNSSKKRVRFDVASRSRSRDDEFQNTSETRYKKNNDRSFDRSTPMLAKRSGTPVIENQRDFGPSSSSNDFGTHELADHRTSYYTQKIDLADMKNLVQKKHKSDFRRNREKLYNRNGIFYFFQ